MKELTRLIEHPEELDKETLYDLRSLLALYPYYQVARLLLLQNLYVLHDPTFDEELRRAAIYITDRRVIFQMVEAAHYRLRSEGRATTPKNTAEHVAEGDRTATLIDNFLETIPVDEEEAAKQKKRKPTPADAAVDYVAYLLETESEEEKNAALNTPQMKGQSLIDNFLEDGGFNLNFAEETSDVTLEKQKSPTVNIETEITADVSAGAMAGKESADEAEGTYFTETLAGIYIKQGRYEKALEIIQRLNLNYPKKNAYFADQIRFLEKLIFNNKNKKQ